MQCWPQVPLCPWASHCTGVQSSIHCTYWEIFEHQYRYRRHARRVSGAFCRGYYINCSISTGAAFPGVHAGEQLLVTWCNVGLAGRRRGRGHQIVGHAVARRLRLIQRAHGLHYGLDASPDCTWAACHIWRWHPVAQRSAHPQGTASAPPCLFGSCLCQCDHYLDL